MSTRHLFCLAATVVAAACSDSTSVPLQQRPEAQLNFLAPEGSAPPLARLVATLWAVRGQNRELRMYYRPRAGRSDSSEFLRFKLGDKSLVTDALGLPIPIGDSLLITVTVIDPSRFLVELQPSGLLFAPGEPAELRMRYEEAGDDLNRDGSVDASDTQLEGRLRIWRQERAGDPWVETNGRVRADLREVEADLTGFTRYAIAY